nr:hypothetical protein [Tanacetum cinerariifolium]
MRIDELHKFSDGTLNDVRTALDDCLKDIQIKYMPRAIWRKSDKERAAAMIQAIDKQLKTKRIMRSLEKESLIGGANVNSSTDAVNRESARDVYSKRRIIAVTKLQIVEWHNYKHLDWITVRRDDDKLYKFKEGDFKRLRIQDIKEMLLLLIQGKLTNLTVKERFAFKIMGTSSGLKTCSTDAVNRESARDVYSKRRIIAVTKLQIVEWHNYKHLDWITVRRDDDKLYKFKEGDFKRLRIQDIKEMLLLLIQGKLTNLTVKERFAFKVSLRMFTRSVVIQQRVEDLQL